MAILGDFHLVLLFGIIIGSCIYTNAQEEVITPQEFYVIEDETAVIPCMFQSNDQVFQKFYFLEQDESRNKRVTHITKSSDGVSDKTNVLLTTVERVTLSDAGPYTCEVNTMDNAIYRKSGQLIVFVPRAPRLALKVLPSFNVELTWTVPRGLGVPVEYQVLLRVTEGSEMMQFLVAHDGNRDSIQKFVLKDLTPGASYQVKISASYIRGDKDMRETFRGDMSDPLSFEVPEFESPPVSINAEPWNNATVRVTWSPPVNIDPNSVDHYEVIYKRMPWKKNGLTGKLTVKSANENGEWEAIFHNLKTRIRYAFNVFAVQNGLRGKRSETVILRYDGFSPELSIQAIAIGPEHALVSVGIIGGSQLNKLRVHYSDDSATKWTRVQDCRKFCVVSGLTGGDKYFFIARGQVDGKSRHVVTHLNMPPTKLDIPVDLTVKAQNDHSIEVSWSYPTAPHPLGYVLMLDMKEKEDDQFRPLKQTTVFETESAVIGELQSRDRYRLQVVPFNALGLGTPSETVLFTIAEKGTGEVKNTNGTAPKIIDAPEPLMQVDVGENVALRCTAIGEPNPMVMWKNERGQLLSKAVESTVSLQLSDLQESTNVFCEASNKNGISTHKTHIDVSHGIADPEKYMVNMKVFPITYNISDQTRRAAVSWSVDRGDLNAIRKFESVLFGLATGSAFSNIISSQSRHTVISDLAPDMSYEFRLKTITREGVVNVTSVYIDPALFDNAKEIPDMLFEVGEIRHNSARVSVSSSRTQLKSTRIHLKGPEGDILHTINDEFKMGQASTSIRFERLKPARNFQVLLEAYPSDESEVLKSSLDFMTTVPGKSGTPVSVAVKGRGSADTGTDNSTTSTKYTTEPTPTPTKTILVTKSPSTNALLSTTDAPQNTTTSMGNDGYDLKIRTKHHSPSEVSIRWSLNRGNLDAIDHFQLSIKNRNGDLLLMERFANDQRYISLQPLSPATKYIVAIAVMDATENILVQSESEFTTMAKDELIDKSHPFLEMAANEVRSSSARMEWALVHGDFNKVSHYNLLVYDRDENGANLLSQQMSNTAQSLQLKQLPANRQFFARLNAFDTKGRRYVTSSLTFRTPSSGQYGVPVSVTAPSLPKPKRRRRKTTPKPKEYPVLVMEIKPALPYGARLDWKFHYSTKNDHLRRYQVIVRMHDAKGQVLIRDSVSLKTPFFDVAGLQPNTLYYLEVGAIDRYGRAITKVQSSYRLPPPGHNVEPIRVSSNETAVKEAENAMSQKAEDPDLSFVIKPVNPTTGRIIQNHKKPAPATDVIMVRYAETDGTSRKGFQIKYFPARLRAMDITDLKPDTTYIAQLGKIQIEGGRKKYSNWSPEITFKTPKGSK